METSSGHYAVTRPDAETSEQCAIMQQATSGIPPTQKTVTLYDLLDALQVSICPDGVFAQTILKVEAVSFSVVCQNPP